VTLATTMKKQFRPYLMPGPPRRTKPPKTIADPPDRRVPEVPRRILTLAELRKVSKDALDPRLRPTDRWLERWASTPGTGPKFPDLAVAHMAPSPGWGGPSALSDEDAYLVDRAVKTAPSWAGLFVTMWYKSERSTSEIADALRIKRGKPMEREREIVLSYFLGRLAQMGLEISSWEAEESAEA